MIYEIYPRSFQDSNGDGVGDINGITSRLDYLRDLGIGAVDHAHVPSPLVDFGYDITDYTAIDPQYGTMADFDRLVREAKKRNIRVIMDFVANHTSDQNAWFKESRSSRDNPKRDWYIWRDGKGQASRPITGSPGLGIPRGRWTQRRTAILLPLFLRPATRPELAQSGGQEGHVRRAALLAGPRRRRIPH